MGGRRRMSVIKLYFQVLQNFFFFFFLNLLGLLLGDKEMYDDTAAAGQVLMDPFSYVTPRSKREVAHCDTAGWY